MGINTFKLYSLLSVIVINLFLMLFFSIYFEYANLGKRIQNAEINISTALDMATEAVVESEEMFAVDYADKVTSYGVTGTDQTDVTVAYAGENQYANEKLFGSTVYWRNDEQGLGHGNTFYLAWFYDEHGYFPNNDTELESFANTKKTNSGLKPDESSHCATLYQWLFGESGSSYNSPNLTWANRNLSTRELYNQFDVDTGREPTPEFKDFYDYVGRYQLSYAYVKNKKGTDGYELNLQKYPTLVAMGLNLDRDYNSDVSNTTSCKMDDFVSTIHFAKTVNETRDRALGSNHASWSKYYLTPVALGVTYVPQKALKSTFIADLDYLVRLSKVSYGMGLNKHTGTMNTTQDLAEMQDATGCLIPSNEDRMAHHSAGVPAAPSTIEDNKANNESSVRERIINDGEIEYDLDSVKVKVDYFCVNFNPHTANTTNKAILMGKLKGLASATDVGRSEADLRTEALNDYTKNYDTYVKLNAGTSAFNEDDYNNAVYTNIIARVSCKVKLHIPYTNAAFDWFRYMTDNTAMENHYGIKLWDNVHNVVSEEDGVWYTYTTYYMLKR